MEKEDIMKLCWQIGELKHQLSNTDYKAIKFAEGLISEEDYNKVKEQRQTWRNEIKKLESQLKGE